MTRDLVLPDHQSRELAEYQPASGLIKRGLDDAARALLPSQKVLRVPRDYTTLQQAVDFASEGDTIEISPGQYRENVVIKKQLKIGAPFGHVQFQARDKAAPIFLIDLEYGGLTIEDIVFERGSGPLPVSAHSSPANWASQAVSQNISRSPRARGRVGGELARHNSEQLPFPQLRWYGSPIAILVLSGVAVLKECVFSGWQGDGSCCIGVEDSESAVDIRDCRFADDDCGIAVFEGANAIVSECRFDGVATPILANHGRIVSQKNTMVGGGCFVRLVGIASIDSQYDTLIHPCCALDVSDSFWGSKAFFTHATIYSDYLLEIEVGELGVYPDADGMRLWEGWEWEGCTVWVADSIIYLESAEHFSIRFAWDAPLEWDTSRLHVWDHIEFVRRNLVRALPDLPGDDPKFGDIDHGQLTLRADSPATGAAFDGTNLGAWQGKAI